MATSSFPAAVVLAAARREFKANEDRRNAEHERRIKELMNVRLTKWEWRSLLPQRVHYYRDREAAELVYGWRGRHHQTSAWWTDREFDGLKYALQKLMKLALAAELQSDGWAAGITLDQDESDILGLHNDGESHVDAS